MAQLKNQNIYKIIPCGEKETGTILSGTKKRIRPAN